MYHENCQDTQWLCLQSVCLLQAGYTPLHVACHFGQLGMVRFLLDSTARSDATTAVGYTPLHQAAQQGHCAIVNTLLEHNAPPNATTNVSTLPIQLLYIRLRIAYAKSYSENRGMQWSSQTGAESLDGSNSYRTHFMAGMCFTLCKFKIVLNISNNPVSNT